MLMIWLIVIGVLMLPAATSEQEVTKEHKISIEELPGGAVSPGGASSFRFQYELYGERVLFWGWTGPNDIRVMSKNLTTLKIIDLPSENFEVRDAQWSHGGSIIILGNNGTGGDDSLLVYKSPLFEFNDSYLSRESIPLATIDAISLLASDIILAVAGRDVNGTSSVITLETNFYRILTKHNMYDNLTVQAIGNFESYLHVIDVEGGSSVLNTSQWNYEERIDPSVGPCQFSVVRTNLPVTFGGVNGQLIVREYIMLNQTVRYEVDNAPVQASTFIRNNITSNVIVASPNGQGGSKIQVLHDYNGTFEVGAEIDFDMTVTTMMLSPGESKAFGVGFSNGVFKRYKVSEEVIIHNEEPGTGPDPGLDGGPGPDQYDEPPKYTDPMILLSVAVITLIVVISIWWILKVRTPKK